MISAFPVAAAAALLMAVPAVGLGSGPGAGSGSGRDSGRDAVTVAGTFRKRSGGAAVTYVPAAVPEGARVRVAERPAHGGRTRFVLRLQGLPAGRTFGAHAHRRACGPKPDDAGPHYQNVKDPVQPSVDPAYANPRNEVWLDLTTDAHGAARAETTVAWRVRPGEARSVVLHEHATDTRAGHAGTAGARLACVTVPFGTKR
ncbi:superoxide dismutase family protein [Streptomyces mobaraensis NBRC 13819 = DSM 40847]|uniref:Superoxide dismutase family protein n=1 Tax=Streptomyces mobaraensis TaxID=35621 RepID=A0A5N5W9E1_STRMB|nr:superoxide dismutase family protein [Streptomyces mobaraensis]KAB7845046.1 superoxide dismutase family protein [Streptomyces mobaraensis]QTT77245.1 superoxide dismutase family protein [Streptomyces mobaraensis NBRC 13819 = DSM 40847]